MLKNFYTKLFLLLLRLAMGWLMLYAGTVKILDTNWSAAGYLNSAKTFSDFYGWLASPMNIGWINFVNEWALALLGVSLILGLWLRPVSILGAVLMLLYYFPALDFPQAGYGFVVDEHIIYVLVLFFFTAVNAGRFWGLDGYLPHFHILKNRGQPVFRRVAEDNN